MDAIGTSISKLDAVQKNTAEDYRAEKVMFVIITDGYENASREYSADKVRQLIEMHKAQGWEFIFLGANIDAVKTADSFGISADRAVDYVADAEGTDLSYRMMSDTVAAYRASGTVPEACLSAIRKDYKKRKGGRR